MKCPICKWQLEDHYKRIVYDHTRGVPVMIKKPGVVLFCRWCHDLYTTLSRRLNISYKEGERLCQNM